MKKNYLPQHCKIFKNFKNEFQILTLLFVFVFASSFQQSVHAQKYQLEPVEPVICPAKFEDQNSLMALRQLAEKKGEFASKDQATAELIVTYGPGAQANPEARAAFQFALDIWANEIVSAVPINIFAEFATLGPGVLASAGPSYQIPNFPGAPEPDVFYPAALANAIAGQDLDTQNQFDYDLVVNLGNSIPWYYGTDGNTPSGQFDFVTVALHEAGHGLGFTTSRGYTAGTGVGTLRPNGIPSIFSLFYIDGDGNRLLDFPDPSTELGDAFTGGDLFVDGTFAVAALGGNLPEIFAPSNFAGGSSLAHWDEAAFPAGDPNSLMTPQVGSAESNFDIGAITRGHFKDMGWVLNDADAPLIVVSPNTLNLELNVNETLTATIDISNISDDDVSITASASPGALTIASFTPENLILASTATGTIDVNFDTTGVTKGIYEETITLSVVGSENDVVIPVTIRVIDGTEAPTIVVSPESFDETIEQFMVMSRDLLIENTGDADLSFQIFVNDVAQNTFENRVASTLDFIKTNSFVATPNSPSTNSNELAKLVSASDSYNRIVTSLYATDFEEFEPGDIEGQLGWVAQYEDNWIISTEDAFEGTQHLRGVSDGLGDTRGGNILAISPVITALDEPFMVASAKIKIEGDGVAWEVIPQSPTAGSVVTRLRFNGDGTIEVLEASTGGFVTVSAEIPDGYFDLRIVVDKDDNQISVYFDNELVYSGTGFTPLIESVVFLSDMAVTGSTMDVDNLEISDGDSDAFFVSVSPSEGIVPFGSSVTANVKFDARTLEPGIYSATINVTSDDAANASIDIPVSLTVLAPPTITVAPDLLTAAVDVQVDDPATEVETFTISNTGESPLEFTTSLGATNFTPPSNDLNATANLDMALYGVGNTNRNLEEKLAGARNERLRVINSEMFENATFNDSIFYDSGIEFPDDFAGVQTAAYTSAINFDVESDFVLTAVRNGFRTEAVTNASIILEIYKGGATPADGELLSSQMIEQSSAEGIVIAEELAAPIDFVAGESFWVVHKYPDGIAFPQGVDNTATQRPDTYFFSGDGGVTYNGSGFVFLVRALSGDTSSPYIVLEPSSGTVEPGQTQEVLVTFDGTNQANGTYERDIFIESNDPITPTATVATVFEVSGQVNNIDISDELLLFDNVFIGNSKEKTVTITNSGLATLNISNISSDTDDFTVSSSEGTIAAGSELEVTVVFTPTTSGNINGIISIESDANNAAVVEIIVNGVGVEPPIAILDPQEVSETVEAGSTVNSEITLSNPGNAPLQFSFPDLAVANALADPNITIAANAEIIDFGSFTGAEKGFNDSRVGAQVEYSMGSDNGFGYTWIDSDEDGGPVNNFFDISSFGLELVDFTGGDGTVQLTLPFPFEFYGETYESVFINANGFISFEPFSGQSTWVNTQIPTSDNINTLIAGLWADLEPQNLNGALYAAGFTDALVVQWSNVSEFFGSADETVTFQIIIFADGNIEIQYDDVESAPFITSATVGIENAEGTDGAQVAFNTPYLKDNLAIRFVKPAIALTPFISNVSPLSGVVAAGGSRTLTVTSDATDLNDGTYFDELKLSSNAPDKSNSTVLFELTVIGTPEITVDPEALEFEPIFVGLSSEASVLVTNTGSKDLEITDISNSNDDFVLDVDPDFSGTLEPDESTVVFVTFSPTTIGEITDELVITSNDGFGNETLIVPLSGVGIDPPVINLLPESIDIAVIKGETETENVTITNTGGATLNYSLTNPVFNRPGEENQTVQQYEKLEFPKMYSKETLDTRVGPTVLNASGGPNTFGYSWIDNDSGGLDYDFIDISGTGTLANVGADGNETVALPFDFKFFGEMQNEVRIAANGFLSFAPITGLAFVNQQIPNAANPNMFIAPLWDDLEPQDGTGVFYLGTEEYFIVQYEAVPGFGFPAFGIPIPDPVTFQVILFPDGSFKFQYENVDSTIRTSSTVGIEGSQGLSGLQVIFNTEYLTDGLAITFTPSVSGTVEPGESVEVPVEFVTDGLTIGETYSGKIIVESNDPVTPIDEIPVTLEVLDVPVECLNFDYFIADRPNNGSFSLYAAKTVGTNSELRFITTTEQRLSLAYDEVRNVIYGITSDGRTIETLDPVNGAVLNSVTVAAGFDGEVFSAVYKDGLLYAGSSVQDRIVSIDISNGSFTQEVANLPISGGDLAFIGNVLYITTKDGDNLWKFEDNMATMVSSIPKNVHGISATPDGKLAMIARNSSEIEIFDINGNPMGALQATLNGKKFKFRNGDFAGGCNLTSNEDPIPAGCYATNFFNYVEGTTKNGGTIASIRTETPENVLGEPEGTNDFVFTTLGYGGEITLTFDGAVLNQDGDDLYFVETTFNNPIGCESYPEYADIYVSIDDDKYYLAGTVCKSDAGIDISDAGALDYVNFVKVVNNNTLSDTPDAYDLDGVVALATCVDFNIDEFVNAQNAALSIDGQNDINASLAMFPNPAVDKLTVRLTTKTGMKVNYSIVTITGQTLLKGSVNSNPGTVEINEDISNLADGAYFFVMDLDGGNITRQFVKSSN